MAKGGKATFRESRPDNSIHRHSIQDHIKNLALLH